MCKCTKVSPRLSLGLGMRMEEFSTPVPLVGLVIDIVQMVLCVGTSVMRMQTGITV